MTEIGGPDPDEYVQQNHETLVRIIKHSNDEFTRALCLAALVEYGEDPAIDILKDELTELEDI